MNLDWSNSKWFRRALAVAAGIALALAFHKPNIAGLAWIAPALILYAARSGNGFWIGYLAGFAQYLTALSWLLHIPVKFYPILGWLALAAYLALYTAAWVWVCLKVGGRPGQLENWAARTAWALFCATAWVAMEMAVARVFTGFPWCLLGSSQQRLLPLIQVAAWTGVEGVAFLVVWFSTSLLNTFEALLARPAARNTWLKELVLPMLVVALVYGFGLRRMVSAREITRSLRIALIQPSIPQTMIWNPADSDARFAELLKLSEAALTNKPDLLIWPEAAVPKMVRDDAATARAISQLARTNGVWLIIGSDDFDFRGTNVVFFNSSFLVNPHGEFAGTYRKRRLVIFGEYVPLIDWVPWVKYFTPITGGFTAGDRPVTFDLGELGVKTSVLICFEDVFPHYAREHADDVDFLVNITNDGWFGESAAHWQQAACAALRAVENGVPLVRCANNGLSCWIDRFGGMNNIYFDGSSDIYQAGFKIIALPLPLDGRRPAPTFYRQHGDVFGWSCVVVTIAALATRVLFRKTTTV